jgi:hypothetical protein
MALQPTSTLDPHDDLAIQPPAAGGGGPKPSAGSIWSIPLMCMGVGLVACCLLIPASDDNRRLVYEREKLRRDLEAVNEQVRTNDLFLRKLANDPTLAERLATRQMRLVREGANVLHLRGEQRREDLSPFLLVTVPPPEPMPEYVPIGGRLAAFCRAPRSQLYLTGAGMLMVAVGLVLGSAPATEPRRL